VTNVDELANFIRRVDGNNDKDAIDLARDLWSEGYFLNQEWHDIALFIYTINEDKTMGAGTLAESLVEEFDER